jgi:hypothetical protein
VQRSRSVLRGVSAEQLAPYLPTFPFSPTEVKFIQHLWVYRYAAVMTDPTVKETMRSLAELYRNLASQIEELEWLRGNLIVDRR